MKKLLSLVCIILVLATMTTPVTAAKKDTKAPVITKTNPVDYGTDVMIDGTIIIRFNENIQKGKNIAKIALKEAETKKIAFTYEINEKFISITPKAALKYNTFYSITIPAATVKDSAGNNFTKAYTFNFITEEDPTKSTNQTGTNKSYQYTIEIEATFDEELTEVKIAYLKKC